MDDSLEGAAVGLAVVVESTVLVRTAGGLAVVVEI